MTIIDNFLNRITMYRLILYYLIGLVMVAAGLGAAGMLPYSPATIVGFALFAVAFCLATNEIFARVYGVIVNIESVYISALILVLIISPGLSVANLAFLGWACVWAMASKFMFAVNKKHLFNPVALAVAITALVLGRSASWWVGNAALLPFVILGGLLVVRKIHRFDLVASFAIAAIATTSILAILGGQRLEPTLKVLLVDAPLFFLGFVMLTEPFTTPPTRGLQATYGVLVGILFAPQIHLGSFYMTPELALLAGNLFAYIVSPKRRLVLTFVTKRQLGPGIWDFVFRPDVSLKFTPGQYLEWTLDVSSADARGNRRYFTIASSPTEREIHMGVKFYDAPSRFKQSLGDLKAGDTILASQLAGNFTLPTDVSQKAVLIAGGIGVTPYRSMAKYLTDTKERRDIVMFYSAKSPAELVYQDTFSAAGPSGWRSIYVASDKTSIPANWPGHVGPIDVAMVQQEVPDYRDRIFYLSGPHAMVVAFERLLRQLGVPGRQIKKDYFPGFA